MTFEQKISLTSLVIALMSVIVGPGLTWFLTRRQLLVSLQISNKQLIAPMRQAWVTALREQIAELASSSTFYQAHAGAQTDEKYQRLVMLEHNISLMLNTNEEDHQRLLARIRLMLTSLRDPDGFGKFHNEVIELSRKILKREWDRVKEPLLESPS